MCGPSGFTIGNFVNRILPRNFRRDRADFPRDQWANFLVSVDPESAADPVRYDLLRAAPASDLALPFHSGDPCEIRLSNSRSCGLSKNCSSATSKYFGELTWMPLALTRSMRISSAVEMVP
jgi:hypothetical protein